MKRVLPVLLSVAFAMASCDEGGNDVSGPFAIIMSADANGSAVATVDGTPVSTAEDGDVVTITATPDAGYMFKQWVTVAGVFPGFNEGSSAVTNPAVFVMNDRELKIKAEFIRQTSVSATINGVTWAECNAGVSGSFAARAEDYGTYYQWNRSKGWLPTDDIADWDDSGADGDKWAAGNDPCPAGWNVPTKDEMDKLLDAAKVSYGWTKLNGVNGCRFTDKSSGATIFLPAAGNLVQGTLADEDTMGCYWSGSVYEPGGSVWYLRSDDANTVMLLAPRYVGVSVRCVRR